MSAYVLLCNFTDQGVRTIKDAPKRRKAARELAKKIGVEVKTAYLAIGPYDLLIHVEAPTMKGCHLSLIAGFQGKRADDHVEGVLRGASRQDRLSGRLKRRKPRFVPTGLSDLTLLQGAEIHSGAKHLALLATPFRFGTFLPIKNFCAARTGHPE